MANPRVLVVDDDAWILRMVTTVLEKRGYSIITAQDGEKGLEKARGERPDLIITDVMMPKMDGWTLVKQLRSLSDFTFVPVIFLTALGSDEARIRGFRLGADDYLPKPFRFEELDLRVANALRRRKELEASIPAQARASRPQERPSLKGSLDLIGLPGLLTLLEMEKKSGVLVLTSADGGETGRVFLNRGRVVQARIDGQADPRNREAVYFLLGWTGGTFEFAALDVDMEDQVNSSTTNLLMEGARRLDEAQAGLA